MHGAGRTNAKPGGRPPTRYNLPERLAARYEDALNDPALIESRDELALTKAILEELLQAWNEAPLFEELNIALENLRDAIQDGDLRRVRDAHLAALAAFEADGSKWQLIRESMRVIEQRRKLAGTEVSRLQALNQMITAQQSMALLMSVKDIMLGILDQVSTDPIEVQRLRNAVAAEIRALANKS